jgi:hypothetical protein
MALRLVRPISLGEVSARFPDALVAPTTAKELEFASLVSTTLSPLGDVDTPQTNTRLKYSNNNQLVF